MKSEDASRHASDADRHALQTFIVELGAAMNEAGETVYSVQDRLTAIAAAYGADTARISAFPTFMIVTIVRGEPATLELTTGLGGSPRLDQIAAIDRLAVQAERGEVTVARGLEALDEVRAMRPRFGRPQTIAGYAVFAVGICLTLHPSLRDVLAAAALGGLVGVLQSIGKAHSPSRVLLPVLAAFAVSALGAMAVRRGLAGPGLRAIVASLVVFLPGATLTTAVLELAAGQMVSGASRLVSGAMQLTLLTFGIIAGIEAVGVPTERVLRGSPEVLGAWAPWLGVAVFAVGVLVANSAPARSFPGLIAVLYSAWIGQVIGNQLFGIYVSALIGAAVMTPVAYWVSKARSAMPPHASFLPGFWLLVPGALGLIGLTQVAGEATAAGLEDLVGTLVSIVAVAVGVLCGTLLLSWAQVTRRLVTSRRARGWS